MDMKTLRTGQEQFVSTANHWAKVIRPKYSVFTRETVGGMSREFSFFAFARLIFDLHRCRHLLHASCYLLHASRHLSLESLFSLFQHFLGFFDHIPLTLMSPSFK